MSLRLRCFVGELSRAVQRHLRRRKISILAASLINSSNSATFLVFRVIVLAADSSFLLQLVLSRWGAVANGNIDGTASFASTNLFRHSVALPLQAPKVPFPTPALSEKY